jgi:hypothetical protein
MHGNKIRGSHPSNLPHHLIPSHRGGPATSRSPAPTPPIRGPPRAGGVTHRPFASLPSYPPSNTTASTSIISLVSSVEPRRSIVHAYNVGAGGAEVQFLIRQMNKLSADRLQILTFLLHSLQDTLRANEYEMSLTFKSGGIEQSLGGKETATILIDPSMLKFHILCVAFRSLSRDSAPHLATSVFFQNLVSLKAVYTVSGFGWRQDPIMYNTEFSPMMTSGSHEIPLFTPLST